MPKCPLHQSEDLEPKRKGWFCEECGAIVLGYDSSPPPVGMVFPECKLPNTSAAQRTQSFSLPYPAPDSTPTSPVPMVQPLLLRRNQVTRWAIVDASIRSTRETLRSLRAAQQSAVYVDRSGTEGLVWASLARPRRGLLVVGTPGAGFGAQGEGFFRLSAFAGKENTEEAMTRLKKFFDK